MTNKVIVQKTLGDITVKCEASSEHGDVPMEKLLAIAEAAVTSPDEDVERSKKLAELDRMVSEGYTPFSKLTLDQLDAEVKWAKYAADRIKNSRFTGVY